MKTAADGWKIHAVYFATRHRPLSAGTVSLSGWSEADDTLVSAARGSFWGCVALDGVICVSTVPAGLQVAANRNLCAVWSQNNRKDNTMGDVRLSNLHNCIKICHLLTLSDNKPEEKAQTWLLLCLNNPFCHFSQFGRQHKLCLHYSILKLLIRDNWFKCDRTSFYLQTNCKVSHFGCQN